MGPICVNAVAYGDGEQSGHPAVVFGAGVVGLLTAQIARATGADPVHVVDRLPQRLGIAASLACRSRSPTTGHGEVTAGALGSRVQRVPHFLGGGRIGTHQRPIPDPGAGELLLRVRANALCGTDRAQLSDGSAVKPGHETAGEVVSTGPAPRSRSAPAA